MKSSKENRILKELIKSRNFSEKEAKRVFRKLSKLTHPDITKKNSSEDFINLKMELEEALAVIKNPTLVENILKSEDSFLFDEENEVNLRVNLYRWLEIYISLGIYSQKIRLKKELKERNEKIISSIINLSKLYDEEFAELFEEFNSNYFQPFDEWFEERELRNARKLLINGIRKFLDYENTGNLLTLRTATSYFNDAYYEYSLKSKSEYHKSTLRMISWFLKELSKPPLKNQI